MRESSPRLARVVLRVVAGPHAEAIEGDLCERLPTRGRAWYLRQVLRSIPALVLLRLRSSRALAFGGAVATGFATYLILFAATVLGAMSLPAPLRLPGYLGAAFLSATLAALVASRAAGSARAAWALGALVLLFVALLFVGSPEPEPAAAWGVWPAVCLAGVFCGARAKGSRAVSR
ncbi:MAG: hypothetical protein GY716_19165 [bacterium]|nr:hypothetical protein [bacterium]